MDADEEMAISESPKPLLDPHKFSFDEMGFYSIISVLIQLILFVLYCAFFRTHDIHHQVVLNRACENRIARECPRANVICASSCTFTSTTNSIGQWEEKLFYWRQVNASDWRDVIKRISLYNVRVFGVKDDICQELQ